MCNFKMCKLNKKRFFVATLVGFIFVFLFDWIFHGVLLQSMYESTAHLWRNPEDFNYPLMTLAQVLLPLVLAFLFLQKYEGKGIGEGIRFGLLIGFLFLPGMLSMHAVTPYPIALTFYWSVGMFLQLIGLGILFSLIFRSE